MLPQTYFYRHDQVTTPRPFAFDVDERGWLWEGLGKDRLGGHHLGTAELRVITIPELEGRVIFSLFAWQGKLVLELGYGAEYLVYEPGTGRCLRRRIPGDHPNPIPWFGCKTPNGKLMFFERGEGKAVILDAPEAQPRVVRCPYKGDYGAGAPASDGLIYTFMADPARVIRFDPVREAFVDERPLPWADAVPGGRFEHGGALYVGDTVGGRILPLDLGTQRWGEPIKHPDHGKVFGFLGAAFGFQGKGYFNLSTYTQRSRLDLKTGAVIVPEDKGPLSVDGRPFRFMERLLVFDPAAGRFDYLIAPEQPDGTVLLCYQWTDGKRFAVTGIVFPRDYDGPGGGHEGPWIVLQTEPANQGSR